MLTRRQMKSESGYTMIEMVVASGIVLGTLSVFALFMASINGVQRSMDLDSIAGRILNNQIEASQAVEWDNLMMAAASGANLPCDLGDGRISTRGISAGPDKYTVDNVSVAITREVVWAKSVDENNTPIPVECVPGNMDRAEPKKVIITAQWKDGQYTREKSVSMVKSKWINFGDSTDSLNPQSGLQAVFTAPVLATTGWCPAYTEQNEQGTVGTASMVNGALKITFAATGTSACGYQINGLTPGLTYTALLEVKVPSSGTPVEAFVLNSGRGSLAPADNTWKQISYTWTENATSRLVGVAPQVGANRPAGSSVVIRSMQIFVQQ